LSNTRDHCYIKPCSTKLDCIKLTSSHTFKDMQIINEGLSFFQMNKGTVKYQNALICGFQVLEYAKLHLYQGFDLLRETFPLCKLIFAQTDSLALVIPDPHKTFVDKLQSISYYFDFSNLPKDHRLYDAKNQGVPGKFKIVDFFILECISITKKNYSLLSACPFCLSEFNPECSSCTKAVNGKKCAPGVPKAVLNRTSHEFFRQLLASEGKVKLVVDNYQNIYTCNS